MKDVKATTITVTTNDPPVYTHISDVIFKVGDTISITSNTAWTDPQGTTPTCTATQGNGAALPNTLISFNAGTRDFGVGSTTPIAISQAN